MELQNRPRLITRIAKLYEVWLGSRATLHLCVSKAMKNILDQRCIGPVLVLYDVAPETFRRLTVNEQAEVITSTKNSLNLDIPNLEML